MCQVLAILYVILSLALFGLDGADLTIGFCLRTLRFSWPTMIVGPILDTMAISSAVEGMVCEE
jgi:hypothetical protein